MSLSPDISKDSQSHLSRRVFLGAGIALPLAYAALRAAQAGGGTSSSVYFGDAKSSKDVAYILAYKDVSDDYGAQNVRPERKALTHAVDLQGYTRDPGTGRYIRPAERSAQGGGGSGYTTSESYLLKAEFNEAFEPKISNMGKLPFYGSKIVVDPTNPDNLAVLGDDGLFFTEYGKKPRALQASFSKNGFRSHKEETYNWACEYTQQAIASEDGSFALVSNFDDGRYFDMNHYKVDFNKQKITALGNLKTGSSIEVPQSTLIRKTPSTYSVYGYSFAGKLVELQVEPENGIFESQDYPLNFSILPSIEARFTDDNNTESIWLKFGYGLGSSGFDEYIVQYDGNGYAENILGLRKDLYLSSDGFSIFSVLRDERLRQVYLAVGAYNMNDGSMTHGIEVAPFSSMNYPFTHWGIPDSEAGKNGYTRKLMPIQRGSKSGILALHSDSLRFLDTSNGINKIRSAWSKPLGFVPPSYRVNLHLAQRRA
jgi:hypothetical protein